jgi:hypothetical protein
MIKATEWRYDRLWVFIEARVDVIEESVEREGDTESDLNGFGKFLVDSPVCHRVTLDFLYQKPNKRGGEAPV